MQLVNMRRSQTVSHNSVGVIYLPVITMVYFLFFVMFEPEVCKASKKKHDVDMTYRSCWASCIQPFNLVLQLKNPESAQRENN